MAEATKETRREQAQSTQKKIFNAALRVMQERGYEKTTIREICKQANTSLGSFYTYFKSKDAVLQAFYDEAVTTYTASPQSANNLQDTQANILDFYDWYADYVTTIGVDFCRIFFSPSNRALDTDKVYNQIMQTTLKFITQGFQEQVFDKNQTTPRGLNKDICIVFKGALLDWCAENGNYNLKQYTHHLLTTYLKAVTLK
ncbi:TetR/AcrR family transcriptional regulator [Levilactobacillus angrenensis]|uniref:TetR/AcrR family transcriptional regulator n=1 Tax=Levilactobacillus angrenensis TaxID=2486020 RepID=A0ABW1UAW5_9LACO|nr:TetR/AcrR family transcriptional regulator [Levilactobacillus angrenensis]